MTSLMPVITSLEEEIRLLRRIKTILETEKFKVLFGKLSEVDQNTLLELARTKKERALKEKILEFTERVKDYENMSIDTLRYIGGSQGILYYSSMSKAELIQEIKKNECPDSDRESTEGGQVGGLGRKPNGHTSPAIQQQQP